MEHIGHENNREFWFCTESTLLQRNWCFKEKGITEEDYLLIRKSPVGSEVKEWNQSGGQQIYLKMQSGDRGRTWETPNRERYRTKLHGHFVTKFYVFPSAQLEHGCTSWLREVMSPWQEGMNFVQRKEVIRHRLPLFHVKDTGTFLTRSPREPSQKAQHSRRLKIYWSLYPVQCRWTQ